MGKFNDICIRGIATAVPSIIEENYLAEKFLGARRCKKQIKLTGVERRHVSPKGQRVSDLCYTASEAIIKHLNWKVEDIKVVVLLTQNPNFIVPSTAFLLQKMLGIPQNCIVFDANLGCSSFNAGLQIVGSLLEQMPIGAKGLCMQGDLAYEFCNDDISAEDAASYMLFGSAGSVAAMEKTAESNPLCCETYSDGNRYHAIKRVFGESIKMDGQSVFNFSINDVTASIKSFKQEYSLKEDEIDYYVFHQAQKLILDNIALECGVSEGKELRSIRDFGNTSGASVPLSICANRDHFENQDKVNVLSCGFGVGLSWSMAFSAIETKNILPVIYSDKVYEEV